MIRVTVKCYAGFKADERPLCFTMGDRTLQVTCLQDKWYSPGFTYFRLLADDGNQYILRHDEGQDVWNAEVFTRQSPE